MSRLAHAVQSGIVTILLLGVTTAALPKTAVAGEAMSDEPRALAKLDDEWSAAAGKRDADAVASFYADDAVVYPPGEPVAIGRAAAQKVWAAYFAEPSFKISWKTLHAGVADSGEMGFTSGSYECSLNGADGNPVVEKGKYLCMWRKGADGNWKAVHDMWNADSR
jgi:ketosteroid isomerase-like protein